MIPAIISYLHDRNFCIVRLFHTAFVPQKYDLQVTVDRTRSVSCVILRERCAARCRIFSQLTLSRWIVTIKLVRSLVDHSSCVLNYRSKYYIRHSSKLDRNFSKLVNLSRFNKQYFSFFFFSLCVFQIVISYHLIIEIRVFLQIDIFLNVILL